MMITAAEEARLIKALLAISCAMIGLLVTNAGAVAADDLRIRACFERPANADQRDCLQDLYRRAQAELDALYRQQIARTMAMEAEAQSRDPGAMSGQAPSWADRIAASQTAWEAYRSAECWGVVGQPGGSGSRTYAYGCLVEKTLARIEELKVPFDRR